MCSCGKTSATDLMSFSCLSQVKPDFNLYRGVVETSAVESAFIQLTSLLQMGFGEAGSKIIESSLTLQTVRDGVDGIHIDANSMGERVHAFFGFCDIRNFTDCTEVLKEDVVKLVNNVGRIVHEATVENHGAPNKNIGDAFLLVWKSKSLQERLQSNMQPNRHPSHEGPNFDGLGTAESELMHCSEIDFVAESALR